MIFQWNKRQNGNINVWLINNKLGNFCELLLIWIGSPSFGYGEEEEKKSYTNI